MASSYAKDLGRLLERLADKAQTGPDRAADAVAAVLRVESGVARVPKRGGQVSGDSYTAELVGDGRYLLALSDGMGVGDRAALESRRCVRLIAEVLRAGFGTEVAVSTVNSALLLQSPEESFATMDLALLDLTTGRAEFAKVGAAPTFIKRGQSVTMVKVASVPVGIINQIKVEPEFRNLQAGDLVVMITDGIWDISRDDQDKERWLLRHLSREKATDPSAVAEGLLARALDLVEKPTDDMTVLAARVTAATGERDEQSRPARLYEWAPARLAPRLQPEAKTGAPVGGEGSK